MKKNNFIIGCDLHNTLLYSNKAWISAFLFYTGNTKKDFISKSIYKKESRKKLADILNVNYNEVLEKYYLLSEPNIKLLNILSNFKSMNIPIILISSSSREKIDRDLKIINEYIEFDDIYSKENFSKSANEDWTSLLKKYNSDSIIYIGNDYEEDVIKQEKVVSLLSGHFFEELLDSKLLESRGNNVKRVCLLSGPDKTSYYNHKIESELKKILKGSKNVVAIAADPDNYEKNDKHLNGKNDTLGLVKILKHLNIGIEKFDLLDSRVSTSVGTELLNNADIIYLLSGDPFKQIDFLRKSKYDYIISNSKSVIIGVSAGSINLANISYCSKDEDISETQFYSGLGIVDITIEPHFDINNKEQLSEAINSSHEHKIVGLPNESAIIVLGDNVKYIGEYYVIDEGQIN